ncbi:MAG: glycine betaine ABC transporter substrate-binding protein [Dehalococcoidia bacterium]|nr:glycine betaine ABC transporter substrate-binding protein [Dehalococcoidia bacterium]
MIQGKTNSFRRFGFLFALSIAAFALLAACGDNDDNGNGNGGNGSGGNGAATTTATSDATQEPSTGGGTIEIVYIPGWPDGVSASNLWKVLLEEQGYTVNLTGLDVAPAYTGIAGGDLDAYISTWLPHTHESYLSQFEDDLEVISSWYGPAGLFLTVPSYVDVDSLADLADNADTFGSTIVGIEAGAGMMGILANSVMPTYGLEDWNLLEGSTPAMLAELERAIAAEEPVVVTLWSPGWWYGEFDLKNLEDPENAWGEPDELSIVARAGFSEEFPEVAQWWSNWTMTDEQYAPLETLITEMGDGNEEQAVLAWLENEDNRALAESWLQ